MRSTTFASAEQLPTVAPHDSAVALRTTATFPPEFARLVVPVASGIGSAPPTAAAEASCTRKNLPGWTVPLSGVTCQLEPEAEAYWIDHAPRSTAGAPRLNSSTKSFAYVAPLLPPPPYSWLTTMPGEALRAAGATSRATANRRPTNSLTRCMEAPIGRGDVGSHLVPGRSGDRNRPFPNRRASVALLLQGTA